MLVMKIMTIGNETRIENVENQQDASNLVACALNEVAPCPHLYRDGLTAEDVNAHAATWGEPALYVGTYGKYNDGNLAGMWVAPDTFADAEDFGEFCDRLHADEECPELMMQDFEHIPRCLYREAGVPSELLWWWLDLNETEREIVEDYAENVSGDFEYALMHAMSVYCCDVDSWDDYIDSQADVDELPQWARPYFDYESYRRDCRYDFDFGESYVFFVS